MHKCPVTGNECETITEHATMPYPPPDDTLVCVCGNEPHDQGFYTCDQAGAEVEPTPEDWSHLWCCNKCGRIIDGWDLHVTGRKEQ